MSVTDRRIRVEPDRLSAAAKNRLADENAPSDSHR